MKHGKPKRHRGRPIRCIETGVNYAHCAAAARLLGTVQCAIQKVCGKPNRVWKGMHFEYIDSPLDRNILTKNRMGRVICVETGMIYDSAKDASLRLGVCFSTISCVVGRSKRSWHGLHFKYID